MLLFAYYLLKVIICSAVLFGYYWFFLRNKVFHAYNRFYLVAIVMMSLSLPLLRIPVLQTEAESKTNVISILQAVNAGDEYMSDVIISSKRSAYISFTELLPIFYMAISLVFFIMMLNMLITISRLLRKYNSVESEGIHFVNTDNEKGTPFSFFKYIFWNNNIDVQSPAGNRIFRHEVAHIQEKHSFDKMFINLILTLFWSNPIFWVIRRELNMIHEFIADKRAVDDGDTAAFAAMILEATYPQQRMSITNNFFYSPIKRRLMMLRKDQNPKMNYISRLLVLPLAVAVFAAFTFKAEITEKTPGPTSSKGIKKSMALEKLFTVVVDAGHGGEDVGAQNQLGLGYKEKDIALELAKTISLLNNNDKIKIILLRDNDTYLSPKEKASKAASYLPDLFISVHMDGGPGPKERWDTLSGMSVFVSKSGTDNTESSKIFAAAVITSFQNNYGIKVRPLPMQREHAIVVLQANSFPSVLIEAGFITNNTDAKYLVSAEGKETFAKNVLNAISDFASARLSTTAQTSVPLSDTLFYKGKVVKKVWIRSNEKFATLTYADNTTEKITLAQARDAHLLPPPPPPPPPAPTKDNISFYYDLDPAADFKGKAVISVMKREKGFLTLGFADGSYQKINENDAKGTGVEKILPGGMLPSPPPSLSPVAPNGAVPPPPPPPPPAPFQDGVIFIKTEIEPEFPGGKEAWTLYLRKNLDPVAPLTDEWKPGTYKVIVKFIVQEDGTVSDVKSLNYRDSRTASYCRNMITKGPKWIPAVQNGRKVTAYKEQIFTFIVSDDNENDKNISGSKP